MSPTYEVKLYVEVKAETPDAAYKFVCDDIDSRMEGGPLIYSLEDFGSVQKSTPTMTDPTIADYERQIVRLKAERRLLYELLLSTAEEEGRRDNIPGLRETAQLAIDGLLAMLPE